MLYITTSMATFIPSVGCALVTRELTERIWMEYHVSWKNDSNFMPYIWPLISISSQQQTSPSPSPGKENLGIFNTWYIQSPSLKSLFYKIRRKVRRKTEYLKWGCLFPRTVIINYRKLGGLRQQKFTLTFLEAKSLKSNIGRNVLPLDVLGENPKLPFPACGGCRCFLAVAAYFQHAFIFTCISSPCLCFLFFLL